MNNVDRGPILEIGRACGEPVRRALDELLDIFERQVKREHAHELAEELRGFGMEDAGNFIDPEVE